MSLVKSNLIIETTNTQSAFTCSKLTTKHQNQAPNMLKIDNKGTRTTPMAVNTNIVKLPKYSRKQYYKKK